MLEPATPHVKSLTLVTLREELHTTFASDVGEERLQRVLSTLRPATRATLDVAEPGAWVREEMMFDAMNTIFEVGYEGDEARFSAFLRTVAAAGISRFLKIFLSLTSPGFALRRIPAVWSHLRRDAGCVKASRCPRGVRLQYTGFPFFGAPAYRLLSVANCQALVEAGSGSIPNASVVDWTDDSLQLEFDLAA